jgi:hypothetical protein
MSGVLESSKIRVLCTYYVMRRRWRRERFEIDEKGEQHMIKRREEQKGNADWKGEGKNAKRRKECKGG